MGSIQSTEEPHQSGAQNESDAQNESGDAHTQTHSELFACVRRGLDDLNKRQQGSIQEGAYVSIRKEFGEYIVVKNIHGKVTIAAPEYVHRNKSIPQKTFGVYASHELYNVSRPHSIDAEKDRALQDVVEAMQLYQQKLARLEEQQRIELAHLEEQKKIARLEESRVIDNADL